MALLRYSLVLRRAVGQIILVAAGITTFEPESAARFFRPNLFEQLIIGQDKGWEQKNFQALIHISAIEMTLRR